MPQFRLLLIFVAFLGIVSTVSTISGYAAPISEISTTEPVEIYFPIVFNVPTATDCRYGVNNRPGLPGNQWMTAIGVGHYINFRADPIGKPVPEVVEFVPQVRMQQDKEDGEFLPSYTVVPPLTMEEDGLGPIILDNLGSLWIVGNEPDVENPVQDRMMPDMYAVAYHDIYHFIKQLDPYAHIAIGGLSMMTPGRLQYLDIVWGEYLENYGSTMPVDVWNMHLYILPEVGFDEDGNPRNSDGKIALGTDPALAKREPDGPADIECPKEEVYCRAEHDSFTIFKEQVLAMRAWMKDHGQQNKPLMLSEFSQLYPFVDYDDPVNPTQCFFMDEYGNCFTPNRVTSYLNNTLEYLETANNPNLGYPEDGYKLVQQYAWYSMWTGSEMAGASSNLLVDDYDNYAADAPNALTQVGKAYANRVFSRETFINLKAGEAPDVIVTANQPESVADIELSVGYSNTGTGFVLEPFKVTFYSDQALTQVIGQTKIEPGYTGVINGCSWGRVTDWASVTWHDVPVGTHSFWVKIDSKNDIKGESSEDDNVVEGTVFVNP